jgi:uncharacterized RDD family membrane protein YckC
VESLDRLDIDTPEQISLELPLAGIGSRFLALTLDSLIQIGAILVLTIFAVVISKVYEGLSGSADKFFSETIGTIVVIVVPFCLYWGYFAFFEILWQGRTPGKRVAGIRVIHQTGRPMTAIECIGRNLLRVIDMEPVPLYAVGLICMMCNKQNRRIGDFVAGTIVVHDKALDTFSPAWGDKRIDDQNFAGSLPPELRKLSSDDLVLIETYLNRRYDLDATVRALTAQRIVMVISEKLGMAKPAEQRDDDFLEGIARQLRDGAAFR